MNLLSAAYARVASYRRARYEARPHRRRRLPCPVISIGNLRVGGSGKTPVVAGVASLLRDAGRRPAILSRGYGRKSSTAGVLVVSDPQRVRAAVEASGDEPQMLARRLAGVPVLVSADRHAAGRLAVERFEADVVLLDDGFQHLRLHRDIDLLLVSSEDLRDRVLPVGRLRESLDAARTADALLVPDEDVRDPALRTLGVATIFEMRRRYGMVRTIVPAERMSSVPAAGTRIMAVAGIARPERFFETLRRFGFVVVDTMSYRDHHWFRPSDMARIEQRAAAAGVTHVVTTEKDAMRLGDAAVSAVSWSYLPMAVEIEPYDAFRVWLLDRLSTPAGDRAADDGVSRA